MEWAELIWAAGVTIVLLVIDGRTRRLEKMIENHPHETDYPGDAPEKIDDGA